MRLQDLVVGPWGARYRGRWFACAVGRGGAGVKRAEGDGITPVGRHRIEGLMLRRDRCKAVHNAYTMRAPGICRFGPIGQRDGWCDAPDDTAYNRKVVLPWAGSAEPLFRPDGLYDLIAVLDWNRAPVTAGRGSAIFVHIWRAPRHPTAGCIALSRRDLAWILARWSPRGRVVVRARGGAGVDGAGVHQGRTSEVSGAPAARSASR